MKQLLVAALFVALARVATAQRSGRFALDLDATVGTSAGGIYPDRGYVGIDLLGALRLRETSRGAWVGAVGAGVQGGFGNGDRCLVIPTRSGCVPDFPSLTSWSALAGWESGRSGQASLRVLAGPILYSGGGSSTVGAAARVDLATPSLLHVALIGTGRASFVSELRGGATRLWSAGVGVRLR